MRSSASPAGYEHESSLPAVLAGSVARSADERPDAVADAVAAKELRQLRDDFTRFMMQYKFGMEEITTKISILREEFSHLHDYNPIEHVSSRLKSPESILEKIQRKGCYPSFGAIRDSITDIAGVRVTCSFVSDTYRVFDMLAGQQDVRVLQVKDYIESPKPNGYRSLHAIVEIPVYLSDAVVDVVVEVQLRTIAMDFWASLEHKIYYKYRKEVPRELLDDLATAAQTAAHLDETMESLHNEIRVADGADEQATPEPAGTPDEQRVVPAEEVIARLHDARRRFVE